MSVGRMPNLHHPVDPLCVNISGCRDQNRLRLLDVSLRLFRSVSSPFSFGSGVFQRQSTPQGSVGGHEQRGDFTAGISFSAFRATRPGR